MVVKLDAEICRKIGGKPMGGICKLVEIRIKKMPNRTDSFFYPGVGDEIALFKGKHNVYSLVSSGDIHIDIDDETYRNHDVDDAVAKYKLTDRKLRALEAKGRLSWENNNWFEVEWKPKNSDTWQSSMGDVAHDYDGAIQLLEDTIVEKETDIYIETGEKR
jgi:hypothetical protein